MKKIISILLTALMLSGMIIVALPISAVRSEADGAIVGDANSDGAVNAKDALCIKGTIAGADGYTCNLAGADLNGDDKVTSRDSLVMKMYLAQIISSLFDGQTDYSIDEILVAGVSISEFVISLPADTTENMKFASEELQTYIEKSCGASLPVVTDSSAEHVIFIAIDSDASLGLGEEGVDIRVAGGNIYLTGGVLRGALYSVYDFLERYVGWVFINYENEYINSAEVVKIVDGSHYSHVPTVKDRDSQTWSYSDVGFKNNALLKMKIDSGKNRGGLDINRNAKYGGCEGMVGGAHTIIDFTTTVDLAKKDYACYSNSTVYAEVKENVLKKIAEVKAKGDQCDRISVSPMDTTGYCTCRTCSFNNREEDSLMGSRLKFINKLADEVAAVYPETHILTTAYWNSRKPCKNLTCNENVDILFCWAGCNNHPFDGSECTADGNRLWYNNITERQFFEGWMAQSNCVYVWIYATSYCGMIAQPPIIDNIRGDIKYLADAGVFGIYCEGYYNEPYEYKDGNCLDLLTMYMFARCMWDPDMSDGEYEEYVDEYLYYYYGDGWQYVREYMDLWYASTDAFGGCWCNNCDVPFDTMSFDYYNEHSEEMITLIDKAVSAADTADETDHISRLAASVYWLSLSATYESNYTNGTAEQRGVYEERYSRLFNWIKELPIYNLDLKQDGFTGTYDLSVDPYTWVGFSFYHHTKEKNPLDISF